MQKRMIGVICGAAVVVLLAGSVVLLTRPSGKEDSSSDATAATTQSAEDLAALTLSDESADNVKQISVTNATGSYEVVRVKAEKTTTATDATDSTDSTSTTETESAIFRISGWEDIPTNESLLGTLANNTASLQADQCVEEHATDLDKFGLGKDATQVSMQFDDGTTFAFRIGGSVSGASCNYFALADSDTVYAVKTSPAGKLQQGRHRLPSYNRSGKAG